MILAVRAPFAAPQPGFRRAAVGVVVAGANRAGIEST
jgi:hypothetical protein